MILQASPLLPLHGINIGPVCSDHKTYMVGTAAIPVEEDHITGATSV